MTEEDYTLIDSILDNSASQEAHALFEQKMLDNNFRISFTEIRHLRESLTLFERKKMINMLAASDERAAKRKYLNSFMAVAATVVLLVVSSYFIWFNDKASLFDRYYQTNEDLTFLKPRGPSEIYQLKLKIYDQYKKGLIDSAQLNLEKVLVENEDDDEAIMLTGLLLLEQKKFSEARDAFIRLDQRNSNDDAKWYLALSYVGAGETGEAKKILEELKKSPGARHAAGAANLLQELSSSR